MRRNAILLTPAAELTRESPMLTSRRPWPGAPMGARPPSLLEPLVPEAAAARVSHSDLANALRALAMDAVEQAKSGHPGLPMGAADVGRRVHRAIGAVRDVLERADAAPAGK